MNDTTEIDATASTAAVASTQVMPTGGEAAQARSADARAYVTAVRSWLSDLPADEVEDLTAGMEADLDERAAETGERLGMLLGEPEAYAAELRAAAGLAPRVVSVPGAGAAGPGLLATMATAMRAKGDGILTRWPWLRELRPTWWLARGAALGLLASFPGPGAPSGVTMPLLGAALSFWVGMTLRRREPLRSAARGVLATANVIAAVVLLPMLSVYTSSNLGSEVEYLGEAYAPYPTAATANGEDLRNLYAYDAAGNRIDGVRLFDQSGRPVVIDTNLLNDGTFGDLPMRPEDGMPDIANDLFPLRWQGHDPWGSSQSGWMPPLVLAPVAGAAATAPPSPSTSPSPSPSATPAGGASMSPSGGASPSPSP